jgi:Flp pilus assembly protein TadB
MLVVAMPAGAALFAELLEPGFLGRLVGDAAALILIVVAAVLQFAGFAAIRRLSRIEE